MQGRRSLTATKGSLFSFLPVSGNHIWGKKSEVAVRVNSIVFVAPVLDDNSSFCQGQEPFLIETFVTQAIMEAFHIGILPGTARFNVEGLDPLVL